MEMSKEQLMATCQALRKNDPCHANLNLRQYCVDWKQHARKVAEALKENTVVEDLALSKHLCADSALQLSHFLRSSPSLRRLELNGNGRDTDEFGRENETLKTSIVIESITRSRSLVKLALHNVVFGEHCPLEEFLSSTRTLVDFFYVQTYSTMTYETAQGIGRGFEKNTSMLNLRWHTPDGLDFMEEILFGLLDHIKLKSLDLQTTLTNTSTQALRALLHCNDTLERFKIFVDTSEDNEEFPTMTRVLAGLAKNTGLKEVLIRSKSSETDTRLAAAWTDMLRRNTSIKILDLFDGDLRDDFWCGDIDFELSNAVAEGLMTNSTLETVRLPCMDEDEDEDDNLFNGPAWQEMLKSNHSLKTLSFSGCVISDEGFQSLARGLSCNSSLETLDLSSSEMGDAAVIALVDGLRINKTMKCLDLSKNEALSATGRAAIARLLGYNVLRELNLQTPDSVDAATLTSGLSENCSIEKLNLEHAFVRDEESQTCRALFESLCGNTTLRYLNIRENGVRLDGACATALKLDTLSLETLNLLDNTVTSCGIAALAEGVKGPCTLKELSLQCCELDDAGLLKLGEALTTNVILDVLDVRYNAFTQNGISQFFDLLPEMKGLKAVYGLSNRNGVNLTEEVGMALVNGLRENTKLQKIIADDEEATLDSSFSPGVAREIDFYLGLNRHGRMLLRLSGRAEPPSGLWPRVLANISSPRDTSLLFYFLQSKPKIVTALLE
jgi:Ran GTPase-activating protein (RanGAP) involved in mRNA processing and transport